MALLRRLNESSIIDGLLPTRSNPRFPIACRQRFAGEKKLAGRGHRKGLTEKRCGGSESTVNVVATAARKHSLVESQQVIDL
jgi:hypothetical protein